MAVKSDASAAVFSSFRVKLGIRKRRMMTDVEMKRGGQKIDGGNNKNM